LAVQKLICFSILKRYHIDACHIPPEKNIDLSEYADANAKKHPTHVLMIAEKEKKGCERERERFSIKYS